MTKNDKPLTLKELLTALKPLEQKLSELERQQFRLEGQYHRLDVKIDRLGLEVGRIKERLQEMEQKVDSLIIATHDMSQTIDGIWDKFIIIEEREEKTENEIKKIKKHLGLQSN